MPRKIVLAALIATAAFGFDTIALAHTGGHSHMSFAEGLAHPLTGLDHMLAMIAVGLWASQLGRPALWLLPLLFPAVMAVGAAFGVSGHSFPWLEIGITLSVLLLGSAIAFAVRPSLFVSAALVAIFAMLHGYSHGVELPADASAWTFGAGFIAATLMLHAVGIGVGLLANRLPVRYFARAAGAVIATVGVFLLVTI